MNYNEKLTNAVVDGIQAAFPDMSLHDVGILGASIDESLDAAGVPELLAQLERAEAENARLRDTLQELCDLAEREWACDCEKPACRADYAVLNAAKDVLSEGEGPR